MKLNAWFKTKLNVLNDRKFLNYKHDHFNGNETSKNGLEYFTEWRCGRVVGHFELGMDLYKKNPDIS